MGKRLLGLVLVGAPVSMLVGITIVQNGLVVAIIGWTSAIVTTAAIVKGIDLILYKDY